MDLSIPRLTEALEAELGDRPCLVHRGRVTTWKGMGERSRRFANLLRASGFDSPRAFADVEPWESPHDHVALFLRNCPEYLEAMLGAWKARAAPCNVNYRYGADELRYVLRDMAAKAVVFDADLGPLLGEVLGDLDDVRLLLQVGGSEPVLPGARSYDDAMRDADDRLDPGLVASWSGDDLYVLYTGGTTGMPKGVLWRQDDFLVGALGIRRPDGVRYERDAEILDRARRGVVRTLPAPPFMHGASQWNALAAWIGGGAVVLPHNARSFDPLDVWRTCADAEVTALLVVGDAFARPLVDALRDGAPHPKALRHVLNGGAILSPSVRDELLAHLPGVEIVDVLGSSETGRQAINDRSLDTEGFTPSPSAVVLSEDRRRRLAPEDSSLGWLAQGGPIPRGYLGDPDKTRETFPTIDGVRYAIAGDRVRWRSDGTLDFFGREAATINTGGEKVFAEEVERVVKAHPAVYDAIVVGVPSPRWGQEITAVVQLSGPVTDDELVALCRSRLAGFKAPKRFVRRPVLRRSPSGKPDYAWARREAMRETADHETPLPPSALRPHG